MTTRRARQRVTVAAALVCLLAAALPCEASEATRLNDEGLAALGRQDYAAAIAAFKAALKAEPRAAAVRRNLVLAYNNYGVTQLANDKFDLAVAAFRAALAIEPHDEGVLGNLARAYNSRGVALIEAKSYTAAENYLLEAIRYRPDEKTFRQNLSVAMTYRGGALYDRHERGTAFHTLREALQYDPQNGAALMLLGEICYEQQRLGWALYYLRAAYKLDPARFATLEERIKKLEKEAGVEGAFKRWAAGIFDIHYDGDLEALDLESLRAHLHDAYYGVGGQFGYYPRHVVVVLIYSPEDFARIRSVPEWVAGLYDGKIRLPAAKAMADEASGDEASDDEATKRLIRHEYTHAVVGDLSKNCCAVWLNEGLAKYMEYHDSRDGMPTPLLARRFRAGTLLSFAELQGEFIKIVGREKVQLAYEQSYSLTAYIIERYGMWKVKRMLARYAAGENTTSVLANEFYRTPRRFEQEWLEHLERRTD
jgi:tetratricopeptide (TPR) repeat protein